MLFYFFFFFFFKQKTAYEMRISDWSSDVCSSDLGCGDPGALSATRRSPTLFAGAASAASPWLARRGMTRHQPIRIDAARCCSEPACSTDRSEEHTSELQSLMRISYAVFCLKKKNTTRALQTTHNTTAKLRSHLTP